MIGQPKVRSFPVMRNWSVGDHCWLHNERNHSILNIAKSENFPQNTFDEFFPYNRRGSESPPTFKIMEVFPNCKIDAVHHLSAPQLEWVQQICKGRTKRLQSVMQLPTVCSLTGKFLLNYRNLNCNVIFHGISHAFCLKFNSFSWLWKFDML